MDKNAVSTNIFHYSVLSICRYLFERISFFTVDIYDIIIYIYDIYTICKFVQKMCMISYIENMVIDDLSYLHSDSLKIFSQTNSNASSDPKSIDQVSSHDI